MSAAPELSSINTVLGDLTARIARMAEELAGTERDSSAGGLFEVERALLAAKRRLDQVMEELS